MCGLCGLVAEQLDWSDAVASNKPRRQERYIKIRYLNTILKPCNIQVADFQGVNYMISNRTGSTAIANGMHALWVEVEKVNSKMIDVLDPHYLKQLEEIVK